ncbi:MAG: AAA domain-containing protein [Synergistaceae bacterium]
MENKEKAISLFKYIMELYAQRYQVVSDINAQEWTKFVANIPQHADYIVFNYMDRTTEETDKSSDNTVLLQVTKPEFERPLFLPKSLIGWIKDGWERFNGILEKIESKPVIKAVSAQSVINANDLTTTDDIALVLFDDDILRIKEFKAFERQRDIWAQEQRKIDKTRKLFNELHLKYIDLERDSETIEIMLGQGILECELTNKKRACHPVLLKKVSIEFDALNNIIRIVDTDSDPEIYTMLLQGIDFINHTAVKTLKEQLIQDYYHPLDRNDTPDFLKKMAHGLHAESRYSENQDSTFTFDDKLVIFDKPVFFIRKRTGGVVKAIEEIINQLEETGEISGPLLNLIGESVPQFDEVKDILDVSESLSAINGEDKEILLSKEANCEQLEIAKRIENYNAVLVQGPPGTGKTHTIANLMGHFLAQGKNVLVTSHTKKALSVVKEKVVPELQHLCVSVLDDNSKDMERSIDGITEYISSHSSLELLENTGKLKEKREKIINDLDLVRKNIFSIKYKEFETIVFGGESYSPAQAAKFVYDIKDELSYIPGKVTLGKPLPVTMADLELLYKTNKLVSFQEEQELNSTLPNPNLFPVSSEFEAIILEETKTINDMKKLSSNMPERLVLDFESLQITLDGSPLYNSYHHQELLELKRYIADTSFFAEKIDEWCNYAVLDGKKGGGFKAAWETLVQKIEDTYKYASDNVMLLLGKSIESSISVVSLPTFSAINGMKEHLLKGKKLNSFTFMKPKEWMKIYNSVKINQKPIETPQDCDVLTGFYQLAIMRQEIANLWGELIKKRGGIDFISFGTEPEQVAISHIEKIKKFINWHQDTFSQINEKVAHAGFSNCVLAEKKEYISAIEEVNDNIKTVYHTLPILIDIAEKMNNHLIPIRDRYAQLSTVLTDELCQQSTVCKNLQSAILQKNVEQYNHWHTELSELYAKYFYINERQRILSDINIYAPEWANLIKSRIGIHGEDTVPTNIEEAWKWKQFAGEISEITAMPFEELQLKAVVLSTELRKATAKLAENSAWYHLLRRVENDISQKQALQGWKLTVKKIGKGTGKTAPALRREAQRLMAKCQKAVPAWVMPINKALESLDPKTNKFDIVIIDEASQSDISALAIIYLAKKIIIVGDDEQVSPSAVGIDVDKMTNLANMFIKGIIPNAHLYDMKSSLYDIAKTTFPTLMLREHFRCVPDIIGYSNRLSYDYKIKPLRDESNVIVKPATISYRVTNGARDIRRKTNIQEAETIVALMLACMEFEEYKDMTFGAISLIGDEQASVINNMAVEKISPLDFEKRRILCGNASHFQGDERDIIFLSLVDNNEGEGPLRLTGEGIGKATKQRYNVAASRAKNQLWVVHSLDVSKDLKAGDMRRDLIEYAMNPSSFKEQINEIKAKADSPFEVAVAKALTIQGYNIVQQWKVGSYRIDMVAVCGDNKIAIECDGELYHSGDEKIREDMERQAILERLGWRFIRIRGSEYYGNPSQTITRVVDELTAFGIEPESIEVNPAETVRLKEDVIIRAEQIIEQWRNDKEDELDNEEDNVDASETILSQNVLQLTL